MKLGKKNALFDPHALRLKHYIASTYVPPPYAQYTWGITNWGMMLNGPDPNAPKGVPADGLGDCTIAACGHAVQVWTKGKTNPIDALILKKYEEWDGYVLGDPNTDQGGVETTVLKDWHQQTFGGHVLRAYVTPQPQNFGHVMHSIAEFGGIYIGFQVPNSALTQNEKGQIWDVVADDGGIAGGHAVYCPAYHVKDTSANGVTTITCITWGMLQKMTLAFWDKYCVAPETRLLTADLRWVQAKDFQVGDLIMGFDEHGPRRRWKKGIIEAVPMIERPCFELLFSDGTSVVCSAEHQWLCDGGDGAHWVRTDHLRCGKNCASHVIKPLDVWKTDASREAGYLAAAFDGEGCLTQVDLSDKTYSVGAAVAHYSKGAAATKLSFSQKNNAMLHEVGKCLTEKKFPFCRGTPSPQGQYALTLSRRRELLRFLGSMRPARLLDNFDPDTMGGLSGDSSRSVRLLKARDIGTKPVIAIQTSCKTYIAEGFASHNCDESHTLLGSAWQPKGIKVAQLEADLASVTG